MPEPLTAAEWKVMKIVWRQKSCIAREVYEEARREFGWAPTTTKTLLRRLVEKNHLRVTAVGTSYLYRPARPPWQSLAGAADTLLQNTLEGLDGKLLAYMVQKSRLTPDDFAQLRGSGCTRDGRREQRGGRAVMTVELLNDWGAAWTGFMTRALVDASVLLALIVVVWLPVRGACRPRWLMACSAWCS